MSFKISLAIYRWILVRITGHNHLAIKSD